MYHNVRGICFYMFQPSGKSSVRCSVSVASMRLTPKKEREEEAKQDEEDENNLPIKCKLALR